MLILDILTSQIYTYSSCSGWIVVWPASSLYSQQVVFDYTQCDCDIQEQVDAKKDENLDKYGVKSHWTGWDLGLMCQ